MQSRESLGQYASIHAWMFCSSFSSILVLELAHRRTAMEPVPSGADRFAEPAGARIFLSSTGKALGLCATTHPRRLQQAQEKIR